MKWTQLCTIQLNTLISIKEFEQHDKNARSHNISCKDRVPIWETYAITETQNTMTMINSISLYVRQDNLRTNAYNSGAQSICWGWIYVNENAKHRG